MESMLTSPGQLFQRVCLLLPVDGERPRCVQTYSYGGDEATKWKILNTKKNIANRQKKSYEDVLQKLHNILANADNKYIKSFLGAKEYVETHLKDKIWDVKLSIHTNMSPNQLIHKGKLYAPTVKKLPY
jgi:hypothetical protein